MTIGDDGDDGDVTIKFTQDRSILVLAPHAEYGTATGSHKLLV